MGSLTRRRLIALTSTSLISFQIAEAQQSPTASDVKNEPTMSIPETIEYSVVRLYMKTSAGYKVGTGFLFNFFINGQICHPCIVSNKHVFEGASSCSFKLARRSANGRPSLDDHIEISFDNLKEMVAPHPDDTVDLVIFPLMPLLQQKALSLEELFVRFLTRDLIPPPTRMHYLSAGENIITAGFPSDVYDKAHELPVFHRGITSTSPGIRFENTNEFLVDIATWPGSSGSPVFVYDPMGWLDVQSHTMQMTPRIYLIGVVRGVYEISLQGRLELRNIPGNVPVDALPPVVTPVPSNLGVAVNASALLDFDDKFVSAATPQPSDYPRRISADYLSPP